jgi:hypothetical protein
VDELTDKIRHEILIPMRKPGYDAMMIYIYIYTHTHRGVCGLEDKGFVSKGRSTWFNFHQEGGGNLKTQNSVSIPHDTEESLDFLVVRFDDSEITTKIYLQLRVIFWTYVNVSFLRRYVTLEFRGLSVTGQVTKSIKITCPD